MAGATPIGITSIRSDGRCPAAHRTGSRHSVDGTMTRVARGTYRRASCTLRFGPDARHGTPGVATESGRAPSPPAVHRNPRGAANRVICSRSTRADLRRFRHSVHVPGQAAKTMYVAGQAGHRSQRRHGDARIPVSKCIEQAPRHTSAHRKRDSAWETTSRPILKRFLHDAWPFIRSSCIPAPIRWRTFEMQRQRGDGDVRKIRSPSCLRAGSIALEDTASASRIEPMTDAEPVFQRRTGLAEVVQTCYYSGSNL